ncbi:hypothetical protein BKA82DRAFT_2965288 [Pisolithus tinctorius]|nr:hypothetical protein BKA82DRAFT_2965288 [Pisolithus tinctorius]
MYSNNQVVLVFRQIGTQQSTKKTTSRIAPPATPDPTCIIATQITRARVAKNTSSRAAGGGKSTSSLSSFTAVPSSPVHSTVLTSVPVGMFEWPASQFCYLCHNGGNIFRCHSCPRVVCERCLGLAKIESSICAINVNFTCPGCHELRERDAKCKGSPYHVSHTSWLF